MLQILDAPEREPSIGQRLSHGVGRGLETASQMIQQHQMDKKKLQQQESVKKLMGEDVSNLPPELQKLFVEETIKAKSKAGEKSNQLAQNDKIIEGLEKQRNLPPGTLSAYRDNPTMAERVSRPSKQEGGITSQPVPEDVSSKIEQIINDNPNASADKLSVLMDKAKIPTVYSSRYTENRRRTEEHQTKSNEDKLRALRQETLPIRTQIANKAASSSQGIQNKEHLLSIIEKGDIDDPTFATLAESLPMNLGKRMLSNDTVEYKSGLIEEFGDLKNIFQGQTRVKELELLEQKIADIYLDDDQKKAILRSRINALKADVIRAEVAQELENEPYGVLQFQQELDKRSKPKLDALFNQILDEQKAIIQNAENRKQVPLDISDPEDRKIMEQIKKEAGGDKQKAKEIAKKKGYTVKGAK